MDHLLTTVGMFTKNTVLEWLLRGKFILMKCISLITTMNHYTFQNNHVNSSVDTYRKFFCNFIIPLQQKLCGLFPPQLTQLKFSKYFPHSD